MADSLTLNASYRLSDYSAPIDDATNTYGIGLEWAPIGRLKLRGSYQHAVRAPSIIELYPAQSLGLYDMTADPCSGTTPVCYARAMRGTGLDPAYVLARGDVENNAAGQYNALVQRQRRPASRKQPIRTRSASCFSRRVPPGLQPDGGLLQHQRRRRHLVDAADRVAEPVSADGQSGVLQPYQPRRRWQPVGIATPLSTAYNQNIGGLRHFGLSTSTSATACRSGHGFPGVPL